MAGPVVVFVVFRVFVPEALFAGEADDDDVSPAVAVDVDGEGEHVLGIGEGINGVRLRVGVLDGEIRPVPYGGAGDDVELSVVIEVAEGRAFGKELTGEPALFVTGNG